MSNEIDADEAQGDARLRRVETRLTRLMLALGVSPGHSYDLNNQSVMIDLKHREVILPHMGVSLLDCANAITADGGDLRQGWSLVLRERTIGTVAFAE